MQHDHVLKKLNFDLLTVSPGWGEGVRGICRQSICYLVSAFVIIPAFFFRKKGILILCQSRSVCLSVRPCVRPSVTFLVNVSPPKPLEVTTSNFVVKKIT